MKIKNKRLIGLIVEILSNVKVGFECLDCDNLPENKEKKDWHDRESIFNLSKTNDNWNSKEDVEELISWLEKHKGHMITGPSPDGDDIDALEKNSVINMLLTIEGMK